MVSTSFDSNLDPPQVSISSHDSPEHHSLIISDEQVQTCSINGLDTMLLNGGGGKKTSEIWFGMKKRYASIMCKVLIKIAICEYILYVLMTN